MPMTSGGYDLPARTTATQQRYAGWLLLNMWLGFTGHVLAT
jgi:hypothetical protein